MQSQLLKNNGLSLTHSRNHGLSSDKHPLHQNLQQTLMLSQIQEHKETENDYEDDCKAFQLNEKEIS